MTVRKDSPLKIRQDLLAINDIIELALHLRRFSEITNSQKRIKNISISVQVLQFDGEKVEIKSHKISLHNLVSRLIHSKTSAVCRSILDIFLHFDAKAIPSKLLNSPLGTKAAIVLDTDLEPKQFCWLSDCLDVSYSFIMAICKKNPKTLDYLNKRPF